VNESSLPLLLALIEGFDHGFQLEDAIKMQTTLGTRVEKIFDYFFEAPLLLEVHDFLV